jgi:alpha-N-arabinofuranosidase
LFASKRLIKHKRKIYFTIALSAIIIALIIIGLPYKPGDHEEGPEQMLEAEITIETKDKVGEINPKIYGHFIEHLGRCIYGGVWVGENSPIPNKKGMRLDVLEAVKAIDPPIIRWPGGCFADTYHWEDGIGPRDKRPTRPNFWGGTESNQFGTDEYIEFCREVGAEPYITVNVGSGTPEEAAHWVEYCNGNESTTYGKRRAEYGHPEPYNVKYWGIGNELFGDWEVGHMNETQYAQTAVNFAKAMRSVDPSIKLVAVGWYGTTGSYASWNSEVLKTAGSYIDYLSLHTFCWKPSYDDYFTIVNYPSGAENTLKEIIKLINSTITEEKLGKEIKIAFDEWNVWYSEATGENGLMETLRLCDGLFAAGMFHMFHRLANNITIANLAQLVNALPAIVTNDKGELYVNPVYLAFKLYRHNTGKTVLKTSTIVNSTVPFLDVSATMDEDGNRIYLAVINKHQTEKANASISLKDFKPKQTCEVFQLNGPSWDSKNNFSSPNTVKITSKNVTIDITDESFAYKFEPHSVTILVLEKSTTNLATTPVYTSQQVRGGEIQLTDALRLSLVPTKLDLTSAAQKPTEKP